MPVNGSRRYQTTLYTPLLLRLSAHDVREGRTQYNEVIHGEKQRDDELVLNIQNVIHIHMLHYMS